jgi:hypothetical protein
MSNDDTLHSVVCVLDSHAEATRAMTALAKAGFDMKTVSIVGQGYHSQESVVGYYNTGERMAAWGRNGLFWGGVWGICFGSGFFLIPGLGPLFVAGPLVSWLVAALEAAAIGGGLSALAGALASIGVPQDSIILYETALKADKFVLVARCGTPQADRARLILRQNHLDGATEPLVMHERPLRGIV